MQLYNNLVNRLREKWKIIQITFRIPSFIAVNNFIQFTTSRYTYVYFLYIVFFVT
jgi:hypothetical protein